MSSDTQPVKPAERVVLTVSFMLGLMALYLLIGWLQADAPESVLLPSPIDDWVPFSLAWLPLYLCALPSPASRGGRY